MCFCPLSIIIPPTHRVLACSMHTGGYRWCTQVPSSPTREECGVVHMYVGPLGALADEGLGCRRALKNVRGFGMRLREPLGCGDPWYLLFGLCALFCDLRMEGTCEEDTSQPIQKFHLDTGCSGESSNDCFTFWKHFWMLLSNSICNSFFFFWWLLYVFHLCWLCMQVVAPTSEIILVLQKPLVHILHFMRVPTYWYAKDSWVRL